MRRFLPLGLVPLALSALLAAPPKKADPPRSTLYHTDPDHPWNRAHDALLVRVGPDGVAYGRDRLEPLLWNESEYLLDEATRDQMIARIDAIRTSFQWITDPVKRAVLQRDLWLVFNWLVRDGRLRDERLGRALAKAIQRLALSPKEIRDLPDNYAAAVQSGAFARAHDPARPDATYLPADLFAADGPWVCVARTDGPTAPQHFREDGTNRFTNSAFLTFLRLPAGRAATIEHLKRLTAFGDPLFVRNPEDASRGAFPLVPNPKLPQFPKGTEVALVRRALLVSSDRRVVAAPLTESVQVRTLTADPPALSKQVLDDAVTSSAAQAGRVRKVQAFQEFRLERGLLFAGRAGGLHAVGPDERDFKTGFVSHPQDEFERPLEAGERFPLPRQRPGVRDLCLNCHSLPGVYSFNSLQDFRGGLSRDGDKLRPFPLQVARPADVAAAAVRWKEDRPGWAELRKLLAE